MNPATLHSRLVLTEWVQDTVGMPFINNFSQRHWGSVSLFRRETENNYTVSIQPYSNACLYDAEKNY